MYARPPKTATAPPGTPASNPPRNRHLIRAPSASAGFFRPIRPPSPGCWCLIRAPNDRNVVTHHRPGARSAPWENFDPSKHGRTGLGRVRDVLGGVKTPPEGARHLATWREPVEQRPRRRTSPGGAAEARHESPAIVPLPSPLRGLGTALRRVPRVSSRAAGTSPVATFLRPFGAGTSVPLSFHGLRPDPPGLTRGNIPTTYQFAICRDLRGGNITPPKRSRTRFARIIADALARTNRLGHNTMSSGEPSMVGRMKASEVYQASGVSIEARP